MTLQSLNSNFVHALLQKRRDCCVSLYTSTRGCRGGDFYSALISTIPMTIPESARLRMPHVSKRGQSRSSPETRTLQVHATAVPMEIHRYCRPYVRRGPASLAERRRANPTADKFHNVNPSVAYRQDVVQSRGTLDGPNMLSLGRQNLRRANARPESQR